MTQKEKELIPTNETGVETNTESYVDLEDQKQAETFYSTVKERLLSVNGWHSLAGTGTADFQLTDDKGNEIKRKPQPGDHFRISIPAPGTVTGQGYDWVRVEAIEEEQDLTAIRVRPATNPQNERNDIAHFFSDEATSSFIVKKQGNRITAGVYGRNEKPNTDTEKVVDKLRNAAVATGAISGFSKIQWKSLVNGFVRK